MDIRNITIPYPCLSLFLTLNEKNLRENASHVAGFSRFSPVMEIVLSALLLSLHSASSSLIIRPDEEARLSTEFLFKEAEEVKRFTRPGLCKEVLEEVKMLKTLSQEKK